MRHLSKESGEQPETRVRAATIGATVSMTGRCELDEGFAGRENSERGATRVGQFRHVLNEHTCSAADLTEDVPSRT